MSRNYMFTSFRSEKPSPDFDKITYMIYGEEKAPTTGNPHYQGYVEFTSTQRIAGAKKIFNDDTMHFDKRRGTQEQAIEYCKKDGVFTEHGYPTRQGRRTDLKKIIEENKTIEEIMDKEPQIYCQYRKGLLDIYARKIEQRLQNIRNVEVYVYWGVTGSGKTYKAIMDNPDYYQMLTINKGDRVFFDGYKGQSTLIIDEFYGQIPYHYMLRILDKYKLQVEIKGGTTWAQWNKVVITSNAPPASWYPDLQNIDPLLRRINEVIYYDKPYQEEDNDDEKMDVPPLVERPFKRARTEITDDLSNFVIECDVTENAEQDNNVNQARV